MTVRVGISYTSAENAKANLAAEKRRRRLCDGPAGGRGPVGTRTRPGRNHRRHRPAAAGVLHRDVPLPDAPEPARRRRRAVPRHGRQGPRRRGRAPPVPEHPGLGPAPVVLGPDGRPEPVAGERRDAVAGQLRRAGRGRPPQGRRPPPLGAGQHQLRRHGRRRRRHHPRHLLRLRGDRLRRQGRPDGDEEGRRPAGYDLGRPPRPRTDWPSTNRSATSRTTRRSHWSTATPTSPSPSSPAPSATPPPRPSTRSGPATGRTCSTPPPATSARGTRTATGSRRSPRRPTRASSRGRPHSTCGWSTATSPA